jgi:hypothetical protein
MKRAMLALLIAGAVGPAHALPTGVALYAMIADCPGVADFVSPGGFACATTPLLPAPAPGETVTEVVHDWSTLTADAASISQGTSSAYAAVTLGGALAFPTIRLSADAHDRYTAVYALGRGNTFYEYTGSSPASFGILGTLDYTSIIPTTHSLAGVVSMVISLLDPSYALGGALEGGGCGSPGVFAHAEVQGFGAAPLSVSLTTDCSGSAIALSPGQQFSLQAGVMVLAYREGSIDATHTFTVDLHPSLSSADQGALLANLVPILAPEPSELMLLGTGLALLALRASDRRRHRA